jgi:hypothetical protein
VNQIEFLHSVTVSLFLFNFLGRKLFIRCSEIFLMVVELVMDCLGFFKGSGLIVIGGALFS